MTAPLWPAFLLLAQLVALLVLLVGVAQNLLYVTLMVTALWAMATRPPARRSRALWAGMVDVAPPLSVIVPAYDEELTIEDSVRALLSLQYPDFEVIVVNDGSTDGTLDRLVERFALEPEESAGAGPLPHAPVRRVYRSATNPALRVVDKENGGKADALNAGINLAEGELFCAADADSLLEADSLLRAVQPFVEGGEETIAVGGTVRVANGCPVRGGRVVEVRLPRHPLALLQTVEYMRAFTMARLAFERFGALFIISGAFGIFRREAVLEVGGYSTATVGEDMELVLRLHRFMRERGRRYEIRFVPEPVCWTQVPERLRALARQRIRWHRGALESLAAHRRMLARRRYGTPGSLGLVTLFLLDVLGPAVEAVGYLLMPFLWAAGMLDTGFLLAWLAMTFAFGVVVSIGALVLEEMELRRFPRASHLALLAVTAILENFGYRQLNNLWRIAGHLAYLRGVRGWGRQTRRAFVRA